MSKNKVNLNFSTFLNKTKNESDSESDPELKELNLEDPRDIFKNSEDEENADNISAEEPESKKRKAAWTDDDEIYSVQKALKEQKRKLPGERPEKTYNELLQKKFVNIVGTPKWADLNKKDDLVDEDEDDEEILKRCSHIAVKVSKKLKEENIDIKALHNLNQKTGGEGKFVNSVQFHPTSMVAFIAGSAGILSLVEVNGKENTKLHSVKFERFDICCAKFINDGSEIIVSNIKCKYFYTYNLMTGETRKIFLPHEITSMKVFQVSPNSKMIAIKGRNNNIFVLDSQTYELSFTLQMNHRCKVFDFTPDSKYLISHGDSESMYVWDLKTRKCVNRPIDVGCISCSSLAISSSGQFVATGSKQGVVNIYKTSDVMEKKEPQPLKAVMNLVTEITELKFNPQSEILAMISKNTVNAFKMLHLPSLKVFRNFPTPQTVLHKPISVAFSPGSGYMSITNNNGNAYLFKLNHYKNY